MRGLQVNYGIEAHFKLSWHQLMKGSPIVRFAGNIWKEIFGVNWEWHNFRGLESRTGNWRSIPISLYREMEAEQNMKGCVMNLILSYSHRESTL